VGGERGDEVVRLAFQVVAFAPGGFGVGGDAVGDERVVALSEDALVARGELFEAAQACRLAGGVDLDEQRGESGRPRGLGRDEGDVGEVAQQMRAAQTVLGAFELPLQRQAVMDDHPGVAPENPGLFDRLGSPGHRGVDQRVAPGGHHVHPAVPCADRSVVSSACNTGRVRSSVTSAAMKPRRRRPGSV
jgi:hypothetical protein